MSRSCHLLPLPRSLHPSSPPRYVASLPARHAPRALFTELMTVAYGMAVSRSLLPLTARIDGWRAAGRGPRLPIPADAVDDRITWRESLRRLRYER